MKENLMSFMRSVFVHFKICLLILLYSVFSRQILIYIVIFSWLGSSRNIAIAFATTQQIVKRKWSDACGMTGENTMNKKDAKEN